MLVGYARGLCHIRLAGIAWSLSQFSPELECDRLPEPVPGPPLPREVIAHAVRLHLRFALSFRGVEESLAGRGVRVSHETVRRWVGKFGARYAEELRRREVRAGRTWHLDAMATRIGGRVHWLWRAVDERGQTLDVLLQARRDTDAAERFLRRLLVGAGGVWRAVAGLRAA